jgi:pyruvate kinase
MTTAAGLAAVVALTGAGSSLGTSVGSAASDAPFVRVAEDDGVVLPSRVANAITRATDAMSSAEAAVNGHQPADAVAALHAVVANVGRARRAALVQMNAAPADPELEVTTGPDSAVAVLGLDQAVITRTADLFDTVRRPRVLAGLSASLRVADANRLLVLDPILALDPETEGAAYADGMADTVDGYTDETANISEALSSDLLTPAAHTILTDALARSQATAAKVTTAFGGGE